jgi:hypothetical protein
MNSKYGKSGGTQDPTYTDSTESYSKSRTHSLITKLLDYCISYVDL